MTWPSLLLLLLLHHLTGSCAQFALTQPKSMSGLLGSTVTMSCQLSSGDIENNPVHWYRKHSGNPPTAMIFDYNKRPPGVPDRFSGSIDVASNSALLTITDLQMEDEADYYCLSGNGSYHSDGKYGGSETKTQSSSCEIICEKDCC